MRNPAIWVVGVLYLALMPAPAKASMTISCNGTAVVQVTTVTDSNMLQTKHLQFTVERGRVDSVSIIRSEPYSWGKMVNLQEEMAVTTFSGDDSHMSDFYENELAGYLAHEREQNAPRAIESRTLIGGREVLTIGVIPFDIDSVSGQATGYANISVEFWGSENLLVNQLSSVEQLMELTRMETESRMSKSMVSTALSSAAPEYLDRYRSSAGRCICSACKVEDDKGTDCGDRDDGRGAGNVNGNR